MRSMRLFYAIDFPEEIKSALMRYQSDLRSIGTTGRFVRRDTLHLTLHFLGETPPSQLMKAKKAADQAAATCAPFSLCTASPGSFAKGRGGEVLWLGLEPCKALLDVQGQLEDCLERQEFKKDTKPYRPHITMARDADWSTDLPKLDPLTIPADGITLFESRRDVSTGRYRYIPLHIASFCGEA